MIIVLKGADFSENNLGQVQVTTELLDYTMAAIAASGNTNMTGEQKSALNNLFIAMGVDGSNDVMSKMKYVFLPIIGQSLEASMINYATTDFVNEFTLSDNDFHFADNGIIRDTASLQIFKTVNALYPNDFTQIWLRTKPMIEGVADSTYIIDFRGNTNGNLWLGNSEHSVSNQIGIQWNMRGLRSSLYIGTKNDFSEIKTCGIVSRGDTDIDLNQYGTWSTTSASLSDFSGETQEKMYMLGIGNSENPLPVGAIIAGQAITTQQAKDVCTAVDALYDTFNV